MTTHTNSDYAALVLRVSSGALFLAHGWLKLSVFTVAGTVGYFESLGLPGFLAYLTIFAEVVGGVALAVSWVLWIVLRVTLAAFRATFRGL